MSEQEWDHPWAEFVVGAQDTATAPRVEIPAVPTAARAVRGMFGQYPTGIVAICALVDGVPEGMVATSFAVGTSFEPPLVLFSVQAGSRTWPRVASAARVGVSVLAESHADAVHRLASRSGDRFADLEIVTASDGAVFVRGARLWLECTVVAQQPLGDHALVTLEVVGASSIPDAVPLVYHDGRIVVPG